MIAKIRDFDKMKKYLDSYSKIVDSWALCDSLSFNMNDKNLDKFFCLSLEYIKSKYPFQRRIGILIWFKFFERENYLKILIGNLQIFKNETHYYVNMALAWFIAELFEKNKKIVLSIFEKNILNPFVINKSIQKIKDSFKLSSEDKKLVENFKIKKQK